MKAFILAAGVSRRLYPETYNIPKCLLDVGGKPIINYQLEAIQNTGIDSVTMIIGYHREMLIDHVKSLFLISILILLLTIITLRQTRPIQFILEVISLNLTSIFL